MKSAPHCLDGRFSTTRMLFREPSSEIPTPDDAAHIPLCATEERRPEGGLRTLGYTKRNVSDKPLVSVITVAFNSALRLENTIRSVVNQTYDNVEYIVIDGGSTDGSLDIIREFGGCIDYWRSEPDRGIYDAMNKGLSAARGEWINFMNTGDAFYARESLTDTVGEFSDALVYYSDTVFYFEEGRDCYFRNVSCDANKHQFIHQSCVYQKKLHSIHGQYLVAPGVTVSDYLFFKGIPPEYWQKTQGIIAKYRVGDNISSGKRHSEQVLGVDLLFGNRSMGDMFTSYLRGSLSNGARRIRNILLGPKANIHEDYVKVDSLEFWRSMNE